MKFLPWIHKLTGAAEYPTIGVLIDVTAQFEELILGITETVHIQTKYGRGNDVNGITERVKQNKNI